MYALLAAAAVLIVAGVALLLLDARRRAARSLDDDLGEQATVTPAVANDAVAEKPELDEPEEAEPEFEDPECGELGAVEPEAEDAEFTESETDCVASEAEGDLYLAAAWADEDPVDLPEQLVLRADEEETLEEETAADNDAGTPVGDYVAELVEDDFVGAKETEADSDYAARVGGEEEIGFDEEPFEGEPHAEEPFAEEPFDSEDVDLDAYENPDDYDDLNDAEHLEDDVVDEDTAPEGAAGEDTAQQANESSAADAAVATTAAAAANSAVNPRVQPPRSNNPFASLLNLGGSLRRQRREWANANGFDFAKEDRFLSDEWARGAAASGHSTRDVVSGAVGGREIHVADLGETTVLAMRRGAASNVVMVARRPDSPLSDDDADDLYEVGEAQGLIVYANDEEAIHRMFDERTDRALADLPPEVTAVWAEGDWVLAQLVDRTTPQAWEATFPPLAQLADCLRMLPPRAGLTTHFDDQLRDPSRPRPFTIQDDEQSDPNHRGHLRAVPAVPDAVVSMEEEPVWRPAQPPYMVPTEPVELPSRSRGTSHGDVQDIPNLGAPAADGPHTPGLPALGTDPEHSRASNTGGRIIRRLSTASTIFDDATPGAEPSHATPATPTDQQKESSDDPAADEH